MRKPPAKPKKKAAVPSPGPMNAQQLMAGMQPSLSFDPRKSVTTPKGPMKPKGKPKMKRKI
jgi:hypothetical protein